MPSSQNPFMYALPAVALAAVLLYFLYGIVDRLALDTVETTARVTGKQFAAGSTTYYTKIVAGRTITEANQNPEAYIVTLDVNGETTGGMVTPQLYESLQAGESVRVAIRRTRFSKQLLVSDVRR